MLSRIGGRVRALCADRPGLRMDREILGENDTTPQTVDPFVLVKPAFRTNHNCRPRFYPANSFLFLQNTVVLKIGQNRKLLQLYLCLPQIPKQSEESLAVRYLPAVHFFNALFYGIGLDRQVLSFLRMLGDGREVPGNEKMNQFCGDSRRGIERAFVSKTPGPVSGFFFQFAGDGVARRLIAVELSGRKLQDKFLERIAKLIDHEKPAVIQHGDGDGAPRVHYDLPDCGTARRMLDDVYVQFHNLAVVELVVLEHLVFRELLRHLSILEKISLEFSL